MSSKTFKSLAFLLIFGITYIYAQPVVNEHSIKFSSTTTATLVGEDGVIMITSNLGQTWTEQSSGITNVLYGYSALNDNISFASGENGVILRTIDGGNTWELMQSNILEDLNDVEVVNTTNVVACGNNGTLMISEDMGETWNSINTGTSSNLKDVKFYNNQIGFAVGDNNAVLKSVDYGRSWNSITVNLGPDNINAIGVINENKYTIICESGFLTYTLDGGNTWNDAGYFPGSLNDIVFFNSKNGVIAGSDGLILKTINGGESWYQATTNLSGDAYDFFSVAFADNNNGISAGKDGLEVYTNDGGATWTSTPNFTLPTMGIVKENNIKSLRNYPNPFNPTTNISYELNFDANVSLKVYDITGKVVADLVSGHQTAGSHSVSFNASNLASGVYFYTLNAASGNTEVKKIMKMILTK